jgi:hypothetical protein
VRDKVVRTGVDGAGAAIQFGGDTAGRVRSGAGRFSEGARAFREAVRREDPEASDESATAQPVDEQAK